MDAKIEDCICKNIPWQELPIEIRKALGTKSEFDNRVIEYSIKNQLRYRGNLVRLIKSNESLYYKELLNYSTAHLMLFPYHLSDYIVAGMRITPFQYYIKIIQDLIYNEKSYDTLPNFTAADCLRLLGIGRNQYLDIMNQHRTSKKFFSIIKKVNTELLPSSPVKTIPIEPWWIVNLGYITEDDIKYSTSKAEKDVVDQLVIEEQNASGFILRAGNVDQDVVRKLYLKGFIYFDVPIEDDDRLVVPPLENFVMNRITGDYFETLLYKIFISIDEKTTVCELAEMLNIKLSLVKMAISMYCRLGFSYKKAFLIPLDYDQSWKEMIMNSKYVKKAKENLMDDSQLIQFISEFPSELTDEYGTNEVADNSDSASIKSPTSSFSNSLIFTSNTNESKPIPRDNSLTTSFMNISHNKKRIALLYDSTLAAFLMMGNLSPNLKIHAVTMFEAGKLIDESLDSLLYELNQINDSNLDEQGFEAEKYFLHAILLCKTILFLRNNPKLILDPNQNDQNFNGLGLDLIRCESLLNLEEEISQKFLHKNYAMLFSLCPLSNETKIVNTYSHAYGVPHFGSSSSLINSIWFKLFLYERTKFGPPSLFLTKGYRLLVFPIEIFGDFDNLLITPMNKDSLVVNIGNALELINDYLNFSPLLIQGYSNSNVFFNTNYSNGNNLNPLNEDHHVTNKQEDIIYVPLPLMSRLEKQDGHNDVNSQSDDNDNQKISNNQDMIALMQKHPAVERLNKFLNLESYCGFIRFIHHTEFNSIEDNIYLKNKSNTTADEQSDDGEYCKIDDQYSNWTFLDCCFGIPLFDRQLNKMICDNIQKSNLCLSNNIEKILKINVNLNKQLDKFVDYFINEFPYKNKADKDWVSNQVLATKKEKYIPYPTANLLFMNGKLRKFK